MLFHAFVVFYEEPVLREKFGKNYEEYISKVPRWIPKVGILFRHPDSNARRIRL
jgi:protein-S-isoprenylcysteine O-methyltransferase Ste14